MSQSNASFFTSRTAGADLSGNQFYSVKIDTSGAVVLATLNDKNALGILQNKPVAGEAALIQHGGTSKVVVSEAVVIGDRGTPTAAGKLETVDAADEAYLVKFLEAGAADGDIVEALIERGEANTSDA